MNIRIGKGHIGKGHIGKGHIGKGWEQNGKYTRALQGAGICVV